MKVSREEDYAVALVSALAKYYGNGFVSLDSVIKKHNMPERFVRGIAVKLQKADLIESKEGRSGGVMLAKPPASILVSDILSAFGNLPIESHCSDPKHQSHCPNYDTCTARKTWELINEALAKKLGTTSIAQIEKLT